MKFWLKCLAAVAAAAMLLALYDSVFNGLLNKDGYKPVTEQMRDVMDRSCRWTFRPSSRKLLNRY